MILHFKVNKPADFIFSYLTDMQKFVSVHPVITKMEKQAGNTYIVYETLRLGFVPISFRYSARVESDYDNKRVVFHVTVMKLNRISMIFHVHEQTGHSGVDEKLSFRMILPIHFIMYRIFRKQHTLLFRNIEQVGRE
jgi:carbon monoxide dehydrogenase subunit G